MKPNLRYIQEPELTFGYGGKMIDPRDGITLFGPFSRDRAIGGNVGIIGTSTGIERLKTWLKCVEKPVYSSKPDPARPYFPGIEAAFGMNVPSTNVREVSVDNDSINHALHYTDSHQRVHKLVSTYVDPLIKYKKEQEIPVAVWFVVIPDEIYRYGRPKGAIPSSKENIKTTIRKKDRNSMSLFSEVNEEREAYEFAVDFRNQLKARLLKEGIITQIVREGTIAYKEILQNEQQILGIEKFDSAKAWNILNTLYYKMGGLPWKLGAVREEVCYVGLVYKQTKTGVNEKIACCGAQLFLDSGDGMVFRGNVGPWYNPQTKEYHLSKEGARDLLTKALQAFETAHGRHPKELFIHAKTYFDDQEWSGFEEAAKGKSMVVGVRIRSDSTLKLFREETYAVPRGMTLTISDTEAYLWTKGFIPRLQTQTGVETPNPLQVKIVRGDADIFTVCKDVLSLTKLNYNSCIYGDGVPVTLRFADMIGEVLTAGPSDGVEVLPFKNYI